METTYKNIKVGELGNTSNNTEVLKKLFNHKVKKESAEDLINSIDTKIKTPLFDKIKMEDIVGDNKYCLGEI